MGWDEYIWVSSHSPLPLTSLPEHLLSSRHQQRRSKSEEAKHRFPAPRYFVHLRPLPLPLPSPRPSLHNCLCYVRWSRTIDPRPAKGIDRRNTNGRSAPISTFWEAVCVEHHHDLPESRRDQCSPKPFHKKNTSNRLSHRSARQCKGLTYRGIEVKDWSTVLPSPGQCL